MTEEIIDMIKSLLATAAFFATTGAAFAAGGKPTPAVVPEIDALSGLAAVAVVGAAVALIRERNKRS